MINNFSQTLTIEVDVCLTEIKIGLLFPNRKSVQNPENRCLYNRILATAKERVTD